MSTLEQVFASGGDDPIIYTLELACPAWVGPVLICNGFVDQVLGTEDDRTLTFEAAGIDIALPKKSTQGSQTLTFAVDNVDGTVQQSIDTALDAGEPVELTCRLYLASDKTAPAGGVFRFTVRDGGMEGSTAQFQAGFFDMINTLFPRFNYTAEFAPGLKYL